ncbi:hypothetical protein SKAU_G00425560 [Synaphobranchus kaupii]|uniref:Ig-like domain-containing protein n=1 Tax=Synaphobranchus kaupii TaxID=118154 RepID=A0A9Q1I8H2_SYNKA|nr:hypothetical protein SKAU_G00425560 [Synaphobranchus kaupii]
MRNFLKLISLNLVLIASRHGDCYNMTKLPCHVHLEQGLKYRKISWYKVEGGLTGLVLKNLNTNKTILYKSANHSYLIGEDLSLILPTSDLNDCGKYLCTVWPPIGHKIQEGECSYYPQGCPRPPEAHLTNVLPSRLSSSSPGDHVVYKVITGMLGAMGLLLTVSLVRIWKCKSRQDENYTKIPV